jgi:uncharacterized protein (TIGR03067 family)
MKSAWHFLVVVGTMAILISCVLADEQSDKDAAELAGSWIAIEPDVGSGGPQFFKKADKVTIENTDGKLIMRSGNGPVMPCRIDATKEPKHFDIDLSKRLSIPGADLTIRGIYKLDGARLTLCIGPLIGMPDKVRPTPSKRPAKFANGVGMELTIFERQKD